MNYFSCSNDVVLKLPEMCFIIDRALALCKIYSVLESLSILNSKNSSYFRLSCKRQQTSCMFPYIYDLTILHRR